MGFKEVKELRTAGKIDEALAMAKHDLELKPDDIWCKRAIAWVYYDQLKHAAEQKDINKLNIQLENINALNLPAEEHMIFDSVAFQLGKLIFAIVSPNESCAALLDRIFDQIKPMSFSKPSDAYSFLHKAFLKASNGWDKYDAFADWWDFSNFRNEDFVEEEYNERKMMSMVEQAYIHYAKTLTSNVLFGIENGNGSNDSVHSREQKIELFLEKLDDLISKHPQYVYPPYYKAKLLLTRGGKEQALKAFLPFAKQKKNDFWVWDLMADIYKDDPEIQFACYCKSLSCRIPSEFLVKTRYKFAQLLIPRGMFAEARFEIDKIIQDREKQGWKVTSNLLNLQNADWYKNATLKSSNLDLYKTYLSKAESLLYTNDPEKSILVTSVNSEKHMLNYAVTRSKIGFMNYEGLINNPQPGQIYSVRFQKIDPDSGFSKVNTIRISESLQHEMLRFHEGKIKMKEGATFAFVEDYFIGPELVNQFNLKDGDFISFKAMLSFNKKKNEWGWKVISISKK
jgi:hypothetical protein